MATPGENLLVSTMLELLQLELLTMLELLQLELLEEFI